MGTAVAMKNVTKTFGALKALDSVSLQVEAGTIHALVGENGAGKTTLMRILYGAEPADSGVIELNGEPTEITSSAAAIDLGIGMVSQHYGIVPGLTNLQNLILGAEPGRILKSSSIRERANQLADSMGFVFDWNDDSENLSPAQAQKLEILKLLWKESKVLILDEPTAMLSPADSEALFASLRTLVSQGSTVILVTHRIHEVLKYCESVTVVRKGRLIDEWPVAGLKGPDLAEAIMGSPVSAGTELESPPLGNPVLEVTAITMAAKGRAGPLKNVSLIGRQGEVVGIAGVDGSGQSELLQVIAGLVRPESGELKIGGENCLKLPTAERYRRGLRIIPEDRSKEGVVETWPLSRNALLGLQRLAEVGQGTWLKRGVDRKLAEAEIDLFATKTSSADAPMAALSGGNQQRFVAARAFQLSPRLIVAFQPARGLDLGGIEAVYSRLRKFASEGGCAVVIGFELDELIERCDRVVVMFDGRLIEPPEGRRKDRDVIGKLMVGGAT